MPREAFHETIAGKFKGKAGAITEGNLKAFDAGYEEGQKTFKLDFIDLGPTGKPEAGAVMMSGNQAIVRGCLDAGVETFFGYPITPATTILEMLAAQMPKRGGRVLQTEDEISAISAAIGASYAGARAATATSGPGLALMTEMMGLGVMAEVPVVIFVSQRGGPSTGMPTKTEQSDLNLALYGGSGDARRIVIAPTNVEGCYRCAGRAFELAEKYQTPVIVLLDLYLSNRLESFAGIGKTRFVLNMVKGFAERAPGGPYQRFALTEDLISPRAIPGEIGGIHTVTGLEHNQAGRPKDTPEIHMEMTEKRHRKLEPAIRHPDLTTSKRFGDDGRVEVGVIAWGSTFGEALEAMYKARAEGIRCAAMKVVMLSPLPVEAIRRFCEDCDEVLVPELNYQGQFAHLLAGATGCRVHRFNQVAGRPMQVEDILLEIQRLAKVDIKRRFAVA
jgi:2-oxoglutarate ferredoxin oxidoreductase subunit alpha